MAIGFAREDVGAGGEDRRVSVSKAVSANGISWSVGDDFRHTG